MSDSTTNSTNDITVYVIYPWKPLLPCLTVKYSEVPATMNKMTLVHELITEMVKKLNLSSTFKTKNNEIGRIEFNLCDEFGLKVDDNLTMKDQAKYRLEPSKIAVKFQILYNNLNFLAKIPFGTTIRQALAQYEIFITDPTVTLINNDRETSLDTPLTLVHHNATISLKKTASSIKFGTSQKS